MDRNRRIKHDMAKRRPEGFRAAARAQIINGGVGCGGVLDSAC
jgi:hypothetical protein